MTATVNIFNGISSWVGNTSYTIIGTRVTNNGNGYQLVSPGVSAASGGPAGTGNLITDNTCQWQFLATINFTNFASFTASLPTVFIQPIIAVIFQTGTLTTTAGTPYLSLSGHTTSVTNTLTLISAPIDSFRTTLSNQSTPLAYNPANGVSFSLPSSGAGLGVKYLQINDSNVIIDGFQFQDPNSTSGASIIGGSGNNVVIRNCILDGYGQTNGISSLGPVSNVALASDTTTTLSITWAAPQVFNNIIQLDNSAHIYDCVIIDRNGSNQSINVGNLAGNSSTLTNCTMVSTVNNTVGSPVGTNAGSSLVVRNTALFGYGTLAGGANEAFDHCCTSAASVAPGTNSGSNLFSKLAVNQFVSPTTDFRLLASADCVNAGVADTIDVPTADDIAKTSRPQLLFWDIGAWEFRVNNSLVGLSSFLPFRSIALVSTINLVPTVITTDSSGTRFAIALDPAPSTQVSGVTGTAVPSITNAGIVLNWTAPPPETFTNLVADGSSIYSFFPIVLNLPSYSVKSVVNQNSAGAFGVATLSTISAKGFLAALGRASATASFNVLSAISALSSTVFAETSFGGVTGLFGTSATINSLSFSWNPPGQSSSFFQISGAATSLLANGINGANYLEALKAVSTVQQIDNASSVSSFLSITGVARASPALNGSATLSFFPISSVASATVSLSCVAISNLLQITPVIQLIFQNVSGTGTIVALSSVALASTFGLSANLNININVVANVLPTNGFVVRNSLFNLTAIGSVTASHFLGLSTIETLTASATIVQNYFFTAINNIDLQLLVRATLTNNSSLAPTSFFALTAKGTAIQGTLAQASLNILSFAALGISPLTCNGRISAYNLTALVSLSKAQTFNPIIGTILNLSTKLPPILALQAEDHTALKADFTNFVLLADATPTTMSQETLANGVFANFNYSCVGQVSKQLSARLVRNIDFVSNTTVTTFNIARFRSTFFNISASAAVGNAASAAINVLNMSSTPFANLLLTADPFALTLMTDGPTPFSLRIDSAQIPQLSQQDLVSGSAGYSMSAAASVLQSHVGNFLSNINFNAVAHLAQVNLSSALANIQNTFTGIINQFRPASATLNIDWNATGVSFSTFKASMHANIDMFANITTVQSYATNASANIMQLVPSITGGVGYVISGLNSIMPFSTTQTALTQLQAAVGVTQVLGLTANVVMGQDDLITAAINIPLVVSGSAFQQNLVTTNDDQILILGLGLSTSIELTTPAIAANTVLELSTNATTVINGRDLTAVVTLFSMDDPSLITLQQFNLAYSTVQLNFIGRGNMWKTSVGFIKGRDVVWWEN